jgi:TonB family protein
VRLVDEPVASPPPPTSSAAFPPREILAGVSLAGPVADRTLTEWRLPTYPEWAKREAIEGSVRLRFFVRPDGGVKEDVMIEKTSGYEDFDRNATLALLDWHFEAVPGAAGEQWGSITLDYRLDGVR